MPTISFILFGKIVRIIVIAGHNAEIDCCSLCSYCWVSQPFVCVLV